MPDEARIARAHALAERYPESREALTYYARIAAFTGDLNDLPTITKQRIRNFNLAEASKAYLSGRDLKSPQSHFARLMLRHNLPPKPTSTLPARCPRCGQPPQCGVLDPEALSLVCSLCQEEWRFHRGRCPGCGTDDPERVYYYHAEEIGHLDTQVCEECQRYMHLIHRELEPQAIPEVDELIAQPLDVMCVDYGFVKIHPNLVGV